MLVQILKPRELEVYCHQVKKCIEIALKCIERNRQDRPTIQCIVSTLLETETIIQSLWLQANQVSSFVLRHSAYSMITHYRINKL
jgi:coatomer subunit beta'